VNIKFDGTNGQAIAEALSVSRKRPVEPKLKGTSLSLDMLYGEGEEQQRREDTWRVPVGYTIDTDTGEVTDENGKSADYADLIKEESD
jgi:hypothetical protein